MKKKCVFIGIVIGLTHGALFGQTDPKVKPCIPCENLKDLRLPDVTILQVKEIKNDTIEGSFISKPTCQLLARIGKEIEFELLLPQEWNQRFLMSGGGGFVGSIQNGYRSSANAGYASAGTDTGHKGSGFDASWGLNNMDRQLNFGRMAIHLTTVVSKSIIQAYFCKDPAYSYFLGCSRGGGQAMVEAQQFPGDFEGIVAGAPAFSWPAIGAKFIGESQKLYPDPKDVSKSVLTADNLKLLQELVLKQCDALDGISDHILNDPRNCHFDLSQLPVCPDASGKADCFTPQQLEALKSIFEPAMVNGEAVYPGFPFGSENEPAGLDMWIAGTSPYVKPPGFHHSLGTSMFKYLIFNNPDWDYSRYDFSTFIADTKYASAYLDATNSDYTPFKKRGGKMIMYHGWNDYALSAFQTIRHYEEVEKNDQAVQSYIRLFMLPGVLHCDGGIGPDRVDWLGLIRQWVEKDIAPTRVITSRIVKGKTTMTRPVFPYPKVARYKGKGDANVETSFESEK